MRRLDGEPTQKKNGEAGRGDDERPSDSITTACGIFDGLGFCHWKRRRCIREHVKVAKTVTGSFLRNVGKLQANAKAARQS